MLSAIENRFDAQDIIGRILPGTILLANLYLMLPNKSKIDEFYELHSTIFYLGLIILAYVVGDMNLYIGFLLRQLIYFKLKARKLLSVVEFLKMKDKSGKLLNLFESEFDKDVLNNDYYDLHFFCKKITIESLPLSLKKVKQFELSINYKLGMIIPTVFFTTMLIMNNINQWLAIAIGCVLVAYFYLTAISSTRAEVHLIFINYYRFIKYDSKC